MDLGLQNKTALVTASSRGLGKALAIQLILEGSRVAICARSAESLASAVDEIRALTGQQVLAVQADVTKPAEVERLVEQTLDHFGRLDILVANAGGPPAGSFLSLTPADWQAACDLTLASTVHLCYAAIPPMQAQKSGTILAMTSMSVKQPLPNLVLSNSLRLAVIGLVKSLADELAPFGIRVNSILPGWTRTQRVEQLLADRANRNGTSVPEEEARITADIPLGRMGTPSEFAAAATFLVSPAASYITGTTLLVDGGLCRTVL
ncbi:MAG: SDR family oxidoreductase [Anaerolineales bacterium]|nr:SDR family oxidoreductase [Anaerolineales bacterium]